MHVVLGVNLDEQLDVLDACIVCCDGLEGLLEAINTIWLEGIVQTCVVASGAQ